MMNEHNHDNVMIDALMILSEKRDIIFINSIVERLESFSNKLSDGQLTTEIQKGLEALEYDLLVYSRLLPFKLIEAYPNHDVLEMMSPIEDYNNFAELFADTFAFYVSGDISDLPPNLREENFLGLS